MITKEFAQKVVSNQFNGYSTETRSGNVYFAEFVVSGSSTLSDGMYAPTLSGGIYVRRIDKDDHDYQPIVAAYYMGSGWHICG